MPPCEPLSDVFLALEGLHQCDHIQIGHLQLRVLLQLEVLLGIQYTLCIHTPKNAYLDAKATGKMKLGESALLSSSNHLRTTTSLLPLDGSKSRTTAPLHPTGQGAIPEEPASSLPESDHFWLSTVNCTNPKLPFRVQAIRFPPTNLGEKTPFLGSSKPNVHAVDCYQTGGNDCHPTLPILTPTLEEVFVDFFSVFLLDDHRALGTHRPELFVCQLLSMVSALGQRCRRQQF